MSVIVSAADPELLSVNKIWDQAPHNAFTALTKYKGKWYCAFREGAKHVSADGKLRVLVSSDGEKWESAALLESTQGDLRDAKLVVTPDNRLMLAGAVAIQQPAAKHHQSLVWISEDGKRWSPEVAVADPDFWLWRITWHKGTAYGAAYSTGDRNSRILRLYKGIRADRFNTLVPDLQIPGSPSESAIVFRKDDTAFCLLRRDPDPGLLGVSRPPYEKWEWKDTGVRLGGPDLLELPDGRFVAGMRLYHPRQRTSLGWVNPESGEVREILTLPSDGDSSYPGLYWVNHILWVSYYSSHEGKAAIYLAKLKMPLERGSGNN